METMNSEQKPGIMAKLRNRKGFSLIEMAIVLVIIGIIIAAIVKGQDLLLNSRAKQVVSAANAWKIAAFGYVDRNARFAGDVNKNGLIDDAAGNATAIVDMEAANLGALPANPLMVGGNAFWMYFGTAKAGGGAEVNALFICKTVNCAAAAAGTTLTTDEIELLKNVDTSIDGAVNDGIGSFRALAATGVTGALASSSISTGGRADFYLSTVADANNASGNWALASSYVGAVWAFDKPY
jgi:prepilin-type N-terminal cleavage/methylation domain-containing protein